MVAFYGSYFSDSRFLALNSEVVYILATCLNDRARVTADVKEGPGFDFKYSYIFSFFNILSFFFNFVFVFLIFINLVNRKKNEFHLLGCQTPQR